MKRYYLDYNQRQIVNAAVRMDSRRGKPSPFLRKARDAIARAQDEMDLGDIAPEARVLILDRLYHSIAYSTSWEHLGETYCGRGQFYQYRKQYAWRIAVHMGMVAGAEAKYTERS